MYLGRRVQSSPSSSIVFVGAPGVGASAPVITAANLPAAITGYREPVLPAAQVGAPGSIPLVAARPALHPEWLGDRSFAEVHGVRFPYVVGEMANGIATTRMVIAAARAGKLSFFGAADPGFVRFVRSVDEFGRELGAALPWGVNLIRSRNEQALEDRVADLLIRPSVPKISDAAFIALTPAPMSCGGSERRHEARRTHGVRRHQAAAQIARTEMALRHGPSDARPAFPTPEPVRWFGGSGIELESRDSMARAGASELGVDGPGCRDFEGDLGRARARRHPRRAAFAHRSKHQATNQSGCAPTLVGWAGGSP